MKAARVPQTGRDVTYFQKTPSLYADERTSFHPNLGDLRVPSLSLSLLFLRPPFPENCCRFSRRKRSVSYLGSPCQRCFADFTAGIKRDENRSTRNYIKGRDEFDFDSFPNARLFCTKLFQPVSLWRRMRRGLEVGGPER